MTAARDYAPIDLDRVILTRSPSWTDLVAGNRLSVDADEIVAGLAVRQTLREELGDTAAGLDFDMVGEAATEVVDEKDLHVIPPSFRVEKGG